MAQINDQSVMQKLIDELQLYPAQDVIPNQLAEKIVPTFQVNSQEVSIDVPFSNVVKFGYSTNGNPTTVYTTPSTGSFYLTNLYLIGAITTTNSATMPYSEIKATIDGTSTTLARVYTPHVTNEGHDKEVICLNFQNPVLIDAGTNITVDGSTNGMFAAATIYGYTED